MIMPLHLDVEFHDFLVSFVHLEWFPTISAVPILIYYAFLVLTIISNSTAVSLWVSTNWSVFDSRIGLIELASQ